MNFIDVKAKIGRNLEYRLSCNFTQEYMAESLCINQSCYSKIEKGSINITIDKVFRISSVLDVPVERLIRLERAD